MEIFALITINIITAVVLYIIFSIRFSIAVDKAKHVPMTKELKDNIEASIQLMNNSLDLFDKKIHSFYQLLRKSEEIAKRLEELNQTAQNKNDSVKKKKRDTISTQPKKNNIKNKVEPHLKPAAPDQKRTEKWSSEGVSRSRNRGALPGNFDSYPGENYDENIVAIERTLAHQDRDVLELTPDSGSVDDAMGIGILSQGYKEKDKKGISSGIVNFLEKNGQRIRKSLGVDSMDMPELETGMTRSMQRGKEPTSDALLEEITFSDMVNKEIFSSEENISKQPMTSVKKPGIREIMISEGIDLSVKGRSDKNEFLRMLFARGFAAGEIASATGIAVQEIELILSLPSPSKTKVGIRK